MIPINSKNIQKFYGEKYKILPQIIKGLNKLRAILTGWKETISARCLWFMPVILAA
jgi:hypothetical protein